MIYLLVALVSYLLGSIPFGVFASRLAGVDVREHGSGNIGATNVLRVLGKKYGYPVFFADVLKGFAAVRFALFMAERYQSPPYQLGVLAAMMAIAGHSYPVWLKFQGGKGVATSAGAGFGLVPIAILIVAAIWAVAFFSSRMVSLASIIGAASLPVAVFLIYHSVPLFVFALLIAGLVIWRHHANIRRIMDGTEPRFQKRQ